MYVAAWFTAGLAVLQIALVILFFVKELGNTLIEEQLFTAGTEACLDPIWKIVCTLLPINSIVLSCIVLFV